MKPRYPVAIYERSKYRTSKQLDDRYPSCEHDYDTDQDKWLLYNMDRDDWILRNGRILFSKERDLMTFINRYPKQYFTMKIPR